MVSRTVRSRNKTSSASSLPVKRRLDSSSDKTKTTKKSKSNGNATKQNKVDRLVDITTNFNLAINELFQLQEYKSLAYWNPKDFSLPFLDNKVPELYEGFLNNPLYKLTWDEEIENSKDLTGLPLRLQKKVKAGIESQLVAKFPFKEQVIQESTKNEFNLIQQASDLSKKAAASKPEVERSPAVEESPSEELESEPEEAIEDELEAEVKPEPKSAKPSKFKIKGIKYSIPAPIVTHPSHIPKWRPDPSHGDSVLNGSEQKIIEYNPQPISIVKTRESTIIDPEIEIKLRNFLKTNYKSAIIDESVMLDYGNTIEEYERIMQSQETLFKTLYIKSMKENSMQLNGDKIELRKVVLPQTNAKQIADPYRATGTVLPKLQGATNNLTFYDHFVQQGISFSKIHQQMRKQHQARTKRIAQMIEQHFKKKNGEKDRLEREREQNLKKISRLAVRAVQKRWAQANKVYSYIQLQKEDEIKKIKGREHLSQMLEHSTQLLEAQLSKPSRETSATPAASHLSASSDNEDSDDQLSSDDASQEDSDNESRTKDLKDTNDMELSVEELRKKYADLEQSVEVATRNNISGSNSEVSESEDVDSDDDIDVSKGLSALYGGETNGSIKSEPVSAEGYTSEQQKLIEEITVGDTADPILDSDSDSDLMESDESSEESAEEGSTEGTEVLQHPQKNGGGLSSLFSGDFNDDEDSDNDAEVAEDLKSEDDENMSESSSEVENNTDNEDHEIKSESVEPKLKQEPDGDVKKEDSAAIIEKESSPEDGEEIVNGSKVKDVPLPPLLRGTLRPYQKQGLNWLASLYNNNTNGILADEMGLGKTIQTISLLSYLACEHHVWGPHLIIVPTSVMLNWEMEFKKFAPGFKVMTYYGSPQQRALKRKGWNKPDSFHVCITSYQLVVHDHQSFKRRKWKYMILDEAHNIKNFRSARWRALLNFNTENRLLLTGTPLQNNVMELWSLLYFLMPSSKLNQTMPDGFADLENFQQWFGRPVDKILEQTTAGNNSDIVGDDDASTHRLDKETKNTVSRLHQVLRPYLLRRLKKDVEKQMPGKFEHIVYCRLSKRQRFLYDDFMSRAKTKETLASGNFLSIINCLMQLRKVCNHPDLFEVRPIVTSLAMPRSVAQTFQSSNLLIRKELTDSALEANQINLGVLNLDITATESLNHFVSQSANALKSTKGFQSQIEELDKLIEASAHYKPDLENYVEYYKYMKTTEQAEVKSKLEHILYLNNLRCGRSPIYGDSLLRFIKKEKPKPTTDIYRDFHISIPERVEKMNDIIEKYSVLTPAAVALDMKDQLIPISTQLTVIEKVAKNEISNPFSKSQVKLSIGFPDKSLLQYDCGKLQKLAILLHDLTSKGHRALIFTQMTKVLDILEQFLNIHGYRYMRLDGSTKIEDRQLMTERFNRDAKIPVFILSTRSGGLGINLTGADTVIFYDSDWNPAMDKQCQDRCHRIGQSREVHIYRLVSEYTIESNILKKANQKRQLYNVVIQEGEFTTDYFGKFSVRDLVSDVGGTAADIPDKVLDFGDQNLLAQAEDEDDREAANAAMKEVAVDDEDFTDESKSVSVGTPVAEKTPGTAVSTPSGYELEKANTPTVEIDKNKEDIVDIDFEQGIGHIDEYMLRFISDGFFFD